MSSGNYDNNVKRKLNVRINKEQKEYLADFMEKHNNLAKGVLNCANARNISSTLWGSATAELNSRGPPFKKCYEWKKTWADIKYKLRNKLRTHKINISKTGGRPCATKAITSIEDSFIVSAGLGGSVKGIKGNSYGASPCQTSSQIPSTSTTQMSLMSTEDEHEIEGLMHYALNSDNDENNAERIEIHNLSPDKERSPKITHTRTSEKRVKEDLIKEYVNQAKKTNAILADILEEKRKQTLLKEEKLKYKKDMWLKREKYQIEKLRLKKTKLEIELKKVRLQLESESE